MKVWLLSFVVVFGLAELYQWLVGFSWWQQAELPITIVAGTALAVVSNYHKRAGLSWHPTFTPPKNTTSQRSVTASESPIAAVETDRQKLPHAVQQSVQPLVKPQLPNLEFDLRPRKSISFTIRKPNSIDPHK
jgi:hypothetical protein